LREEEDRPAEEVGETAVKGYDMPVVEAVEQMVVGAVGRTAVKVGE